MVGKHTGLCVRACLCLCLCLLVGGCLRVSVDVVPCDLIPIRGRSLTSGCRGVDARTPSAEQAVA